MQYIMQSPQMSNSTPSNGIYDEYKDYLKQCTVTPTCSEETYIRIEKLTTWLTTQRQITNGPFDDDVYNNQYQIASPFTPSKTTSPLKELLLLTCKGSLSLTEDGVKAKDQCCVVLFCILLDLNYGHLVKLFRSEGIWDSKLPVENDDDLYTRVSHICEKHGIQESDQERLFTDFYDRQWKFCPTKFSLQDTDKSLPPKTIIPIQDMRLISRKGSTSQLYLVEVLEEFLDHAFRNKLGDSARKSEGHEDGQGARYQFVLKSFKEENVQIYNNEHNAFQIIGDHKNIIAFLGSFRGAYFGGNREYPYHILLEFASADLEVFFNERGPPEFTDEIKGLWGDVFGIVNATAGVHGWVGVTDGYTQGKSGCHGDIKLDNILWVREKLKLADHGFSVFEKSNLERPTARDTWLKGGTTSFSAPERVRNRYQPLLPNQHPTDIWSLGCVLSVTATWIARGPRGILEYRQLRRNAIDELVASRTAEVEQSSPSSSMAIPLSATELEGNDYFHDGEKVLKEISVWHSFLKEFCLSRFDNITADVLQLVDDYMLVPEKKRESASQIYEKWKVILENCASKPRQDISRDVERAIREADEKWATDGPPREPTLTPRENDITDVASGNDKILNIEAEARIRKYRKQRDPQVLKVPYRSTASVLAGPTTPRQKRRSRRDIDALGEENPHKGKGSLFWEVPTSAAGTTGESELQHQNPTYGSNSRRPTLEVATSSSMQRTQDPIPVSSPSSLSTSKTLLKEAYDELDKGHRRQTSKRSFASIDRIFRKSQLNLDQASRELLNQKLGQEYRDFKLLVDNATSMVAHWDDVQMLTSTIAGALIHYDTDGIEVSFTNGSAQASVKKDAFGQSRAFISTNKPKIGKTRGVEDDTNRITVQTDMMNALAVLCRRYYSYLQTRPVGSNIKTCTILIITDGLWIVDDESYSAFKEFIVKAIKMVQPFANRILNTRILTFEFLYFGNDATVVERLEYLDNDLHKSRDNGINDVIDCEPIVKGDLIKMIAGSLDSSLDHRDNPAASRPSRTTPRESIGNIEPPDASGQ
ncbi:hypothetical protein ABW19_dt0204212 [Dactylella cylindrospora]|nr:hypothetical protein ABW19_dt0204212 [Dactylella cylindrospora]